MSASVFSTLSGVLTGKHPKLGILCREDGAVFLPKSGTNPAHWTFGSRSDNGYLHVRFRGKIYLVHRLAVETFLQYPIPEGYEIDHINRNPSDNRVFENLRIVTKSENQRNTHSHDRVEALYGVHKYEDEKQYMRKKCVLYRKTHKQTIKEYRTNRRKTHKQVLFADGKRHDIPNEQALELLKLPVKERIYGTN